MSDALPRGFSQLEGLGRWNARTPLQRAPRLSARAGREVWLKRDDLLPLGLGGNKARKLDLILAGAVRAGVNTLITRGAVQSNHARLTAAAAAELGMDCVLLLTGSPAEDGGASGNELLDLLYGARLVYTAAADAAEQAVQLERLAEEVRSAGGHPLVIPTGGKTAEGIAAYAIAVRELAEQCGAALPDSVVVAAGTGSTAAGIAIGLHYFLPRTRLFAVRVDPEDEGLTQAIRGYMDEARELLGVPDAARIPAPQLVHGYEGPEYGVSDDRIRAALREATLLTGVLFDRVYTGKAIAAFLDPGSADYGRRVVFWHTGGAPELFSDSERGWI